MHKMVFRCCVAFHRSEERRVAKGKIASLHSDEIATQFHTLLADVREVAKL